MLAEKLGLPKSGTKATLEKRLNGVPPEARVDCPVLDPKDMTDIEAGPEERSGRRWGYIAGCPKQRRSCQQQHVRSRNFHAIGISEASLSSGPIGK